MPLAALVTLVNGVDSLRAQRSAGACLTCSSGVAGIKCEHCARGALCGKLPN